VDIFTIIERASTEAGDDYGVSPVSEDLAQRLFLRAAVAAVNFGKLLSVSPCVFDHQTRTNMNA
jgi:hypothetical protein